jgi:coproporphyrinogen III oxidase
MRYTGPLSYHLISFSAAYFGEKYEFLNESMVNLTRTDSLGRATNMSNYIYAGYRINEKSIPYIFFDYVNVSDKDLRTYGKNFTKIGIGYRHEFNYLINAKLQFEFAEGNHAHAAFQQHAYETRLKFQLAYGF